MTRTTNLGIKRSYKDPQFNTLFESREQEVIAGTSGNNLNEKEGPAKKRRKRSKDDTDGVQTSPFMESGVGKSQNLDKKRFAGRFSRIKTDGAPCCSHTYPVPK